MVIIGYAGSGQAADLGLYVRMAGSARRGCGGAGEGLENQTRAGIHSQLNVCYNKKGCSLIMLLCRRGLHML